MSQARKSVAGARRGPQKAHVPYRADDLERGRRTGVSVAYVNHNSDEFEHFADVLAQADDAIPFRMQARKKHRRSSPGVSEHDEDGEMSMELDDTTADGPGRYFRNAPRPSVPSSMNRAKLSQATSRLSDATFDQVLSPRAGSSRNESISNGSRTQPFYDNPVAPDGDDFPGEDPNDESSPMFRRSFTQIDNDEEDDLQNEELESPTTMKGKGTGRRVLDALNVENNNEGDSSGSEEEIARGFDDSGMQLDNDVHEHQSSPPRRTESPKFVKRKKPANRRMPPTVHDENTEGLRRGTRTRYKPLEWWRCEKVIYGRRESGAYSAVPVIKSIVRLPKEEPRPLGIAGRKRKRRPPQSNSETKADHSNADPEEGWDDNTESEGLVMNYLTNKEIIRRVAFTRNMVNCKPAMNNAFLFQKIFGDADFIAAGQLVIPRGKQKPNKPTRDNTYVFYVIEGAVKFHIHTSSFLLATGGMFLIPRGNHYYIENVCDRDARLFFAQARKVPAVDEDPPQNTTPRAKRISNVTAADSHTPSAAGGTSKEIGVARSSSMAVQGQPKDVTSGKVTASRRAMTRS